MNRNPLSTERSLASAPGFTAVSHEELTLVTGGGLWSWLKDAAEWVYDNVFVDFGNMVFGFKGRF